MSSEAEQLFVVDESDCCNNGCTNCILDNIPRINPRASLTGKRNVILNYTKFKLLDNQDTPQSTNKVDHVVDVLDLHFVHVSDDKIIADDDILDIPPGHHIMLRVDVPEQETPLLRPYSPYWVDFIGKQFKILVKLQPGGLMSKLLAALQPETILEFRGPIGNYYHDAVKTKCIFIIAQGVAIAPTIPIVEQVLYNEDDESRVHHLVCAADLQHVHLRDKLLEFAKYWNYRNCLYLTHQQCGSDQCLDAGSCDPTMCKSFIAGLRYKEAVSTQRLDSDSLADYNASTMADCNERVLIIAGHSSFQQNLRDQAVKALCIPERNVHLL